MDVQAESNIIIEKEQKRREAFRDIVLTIVVVFIFTVILGLACRYIMYRFA